MSEPQKQSNFAIPSGGQRKRIAKALGLDRSRLPIVVNFSQEGDKIRGVIAMGTEGRHWTLALDPLSERQVPNLHSGGITLEAPDLAVLWRWVASLEPVFMRAIESSTLVLPRRRCLHLLEPTIDLASATAERCVRASIDTHGKKQGLRLAIDELTPMISRVPDVPAELSYELAALGKGVLIDRELSIVVVPGEEFDLLVPLGLVMSKVVPEMMGPISTIMEHFGLPTPDADAFVAVEATIPHSDAVHELRKAGAMFLPEFASDAGQARWRRALARW